MFAQLLLTQVLLLALVTLVLPLLLMLRLNTTADLYLKQRLQSDQAVVRSFGIAPQGDRRAALMRALGPLYSAGGGTRAFRVFDDRGELLDQGGTPEAAPPALTSADKPGFVHIGKLDIYHARAVIAGTAVTIAVAEDRTRPDVILDDVIAAYARHSLWFIPLILVVSTATGLLLFRRMTMQLRAASAVADRIGPLTLDLRIDADVLPMEVRGLAIATNDALDRVAAAYRRHDAFTSSVAHELRTPMALLMLRCDALPPSAERDAIRVAIDQASHVVGQLFELAMIDGRPIELAPVDLEAVAQDAVAGTAAVVYNSGRSIELVGGVMPPGECVGNAGLLRIAIVNLIDNSVRHTPAGTHVRVVVQHRAILVDDDGQGIAASAVNGDRFISVGQVRSDSAGLGLAIVSRIMQAMGGSMSLVEGGPGAQVTLHLPGG